MKNKKVVGIEGIKAIFKEKGLPMAYGKIYYIVKFHPSFPQPIFIPGYKKPKWKKEEVEKWVEKILNSEFEEQKKAREEYFQKEKFKIL